MYKTHWLIVLGIISQTIVFAQKEKDIVPDKVVTPVVLKGKKDYPYYVLSAKNATQVTITGPGKLMVYTRARIQDPKTSSEPFHLKYVLNGQSISTHKVPALERSTSLKFKSGIEGSPTNANKKTIKIPPGKHTVIFHKSKTNQPVHVKFRFKQFNEPIWKDLKPEYNLERVALKYANAKPSPDYYRITDTKGFSFSITDTARLRIMVRDEFTYKMLAENYLRLEVTETGKEPVNYKFLTKRANNVTYIEMSKLVPSFLKSLYLDLPKAKGERTYTITTKGAGKTALIRVSSDTNLLSKPKPKTTPKITPTPKATPTPAPKATPKPKTTTNTNSQTPKK